MKHAAEAAYCASEQGKFWEYHDILYANQASENSGGFSGDHLTGMIAVIGQDMTRFNACNTAHRYQQQVLVDEKTSEQAGVSEVPSFMVNG